MKTHTLLEHVCMHACMQSAIWNTKKTSYLHRHKQTTAFNILPDTIMQQILANNTCQALLHLVCLCSFHLWFWQIASLCWADHLFNRGVWQAQIITFFCKRHTLYYYTLYQVWGFGTYLGWPKTFQTQSESWFLGIEIKMCSGATEKQNLCSKQTN